MNDLHIMYPFYYLWILDCSQFFFFTANSAAMNILTLSLVYTYKRFFLKPISRNGIAGLYIVCGFQLSLITPNCFPKWLYVLTFPSAAYEGSSCYMPSPRSVIVRTIFFFRFDGKVISWFHFLDDEWDWNLFLHLCFSLCELCCSLLAIFLLCWLSLSYWCARVLFFKKIFWIKALYWLHMLPIFLHSLAYVFQILNNAFDPNCFNFNTIIFIWVYIFLYRWCFGIYLRDRSLSRSHKNIHLYNFNSGL